MSFVTGLALGMALSKSSNGSYDEMDFEKEQLKIKSLRKKVKRLKEQKQKVIALIKDGRFVEALQELER